MIARPLAFGTGVVCLATLLAYGGRWSWVCELLVNFRTHYALVLGVALLLAVGLRHWRIAVIAALGLALNLWPMRGAYSATPSPQPAQPVPVRLVAFNVYVKNAGLPGIATYLESLAPDVVVLEEVTSASARQLVSLLPRFEHHHLAVEEGVRGVLILSRWPLISPRQVTHSGKMFGLRADVDLGDRRLRVYGMHLNWPLLPGSARIRNEQLPALGRELAQCRGACVVVGDFNTTPWSSHFGDLLRVSGFHDCAAGAGFVPTWPAALPPLLRIRIDHCLASAGLAVKQVEVGAAVGSDHLATVNELLVSR
jgi:endonuclease/exonuclease/phosphatase (EEP) superfamily protein YafD